MGSLITEPPKLERTRYLTPGRHVSPCAWSGAVSAPRASSTCDPERDVGPELKRSGDELRHLVERGRNGPYTLVITSGFNNKLPFGKLSPALAGLDRSGADKAASSF